ncbi:MAG: PaaI family thioesterase [Pseudomonadota bacterium]
MSPLDPAGMDPALDSLPWRRVRGTGFTPHVGPVEFARAGSDVWYGRLTLDQRHINVGGVCHGGVLLTLADITMGTSTYEAGGGHPCATIQLDTHFVAAAKQGQVLYCRAHQIRLVRGLSFMEAGLASGGRLVMRVSGVWKQLDSRKPGESGP